MRGNGENALVGERMTDQNRPIPHRPKNLTFRITRAMKNGEGTSQAGEALLIRSNTIILAFSRDVPAHCSVAPGKELVAYVPLLASPCYTRKPVFSAQWKKVSNCSSGDKQTRRRHDLHRFS